MLNILHLASFSGNVGDNANHRGFRGWFERVVGGDVHWHNLEIREFYWNEREFDSEFAERVNQFDLLVVGGGNYFELWVEKSPTGTSVAIPEAVLARIQTPIFFNALGVDPGQGASSTAVRKFTGLLDILLESRQYLVSVRNDGAQAAVRDCVGISYAERLYRAPDGGFFAEYDKTPIGTDDDAGRWLAINVANDMAEQRFVGFPMGERVQAFARELASAIDVLVRNDDSLRILFVPHIYSDLAIISLVLGCLSDRLRRTRVKVAAYGVGPRGAEDVFGQYRACDLVLGMRFHANVCPIGAGVPTMGLECYRQIRMLYGELQWPDGYINVSSPGFSDQLAETVVQHLDGSSGMDQKLRGARALVEQERASFESVVSRWCVQNGLS